MDSKLKKIQTIENICGHVIFALNNEVQIISPYDWVKISKVSDRVDSPETGFIYELEYYNGDEKPIIKVTSCSFYALFNNYLFNVLKNWHGIIDIIDKEGDTLAKVDL